MPRFRSGYSYVLSLCAIALLVCSLTPPIPASAKLDHSPRLSFPEAIPSQTAKQNEGTKGTRAYGSLPMSFEANQGQTDPNVKFLARGNGYGLFLTSKGPVLSLSRDSEDVKGERPSEEATAVVSFELLGSNRSARIFGVDESPGKANHFIGNDPSQWHKDVSTFAKVKYSEVYPGIDVLYYGNQRQLEYDFVVAAGEEPQRIKFAIKGTDTTKVDENGNLVLHTAAGDITQPRPFAYQEINGVRQEVAANYVVKRGVVSFEVGNYDQNQRLVIDPVIVYSSFLGGANGDDGRAIAVDSNGNAYITGRTFSTDFPVVGGIQSSRASLTDAYVVKVNTNGNALVFSTYLGGGGEDIGYGIKVDGQGNAYVGGSTWSSNFPTTAGALATSKGNLRDGFVAKLNATGSALVYSTFVGGDDEDVINGLALSPDGRITVTGNTSSSRFSTNVFPTPRGGSPVFRTVDSAANWSASASGLTANTVNTFAIQSSNSNIIYAGSDTGVFKSSDAGASWSFLANGVPAENTNTVIIDPSNSSVVYAATDTSVYKSTNGGASFDLKGQNLFPTCLAIDPITPTTLYAGTALGLFKTTNGGDTWTEVFYGAHAPGGSYVNKVVVDPVTPGNVYVGTASFGVFKTLSGNGWVQLNAGSFHTNDAITALTLDPSNSATIYAGVQNQPNLIKWTNGGASFTTINVSYMVNGESKFPDVGSLAIDPVTPTTMYVGSKAGYGVLKSVDGGATWNQTNPGLTRLFINNVTIDPSNPAILFAGAFGFSDCFLARLNSAGSALDYVRNFGGDSSESATSVAVDADGNAYVGGSTGSTNFPVLNAFQSTPTNFGDAFLAKFDNSGNFVYSTFLGGNFDEGITAVAVSNGSPVVVGLTSSSDFPIVNGIKSMPNLQDAFVAKFNTTGSALDFSTYLGGSSSDQALGVTLDPAGNIYVTGSTLSSDFPLQSAAQPVFGGSSDAFVTELNSAGTQIVASTYLGGSASDQANAIAVDGVGAAYVTGVTSSNNFPTVNAYQPTRKGNDAFFTKISPGSSLASNIQFSQAAYQVNESGVGVTTTVTRTGFSAGIATVSYATSDAATGNCSTVGGKASSKCDYESSFGTLNFAAGETSKTITIPIVDDSYAEGNETFTLSLLNATNASIGAPSSATLTIVDNDGGPGPNPIDQVGFFVRQHYIDFLSREPDSSGLAFWSGEITQCGSNAQCIEVKRINVSAAFFQSIEFQETGYLVERLYKTAYGDATGTSTLGGSHQLSVPIIRFNEFLPDSQQISRGLVVGAPGWEQVLEANKVSFTQAFVQRSRFGTSYSALLTPAQFVDQLFAHAGVTPTTAERDAAINEFGGAADTSNEAARARALRAIAENSTLNLNEKNRAFVLMEFFGYLRRNPNDPQDVDYTGYDFWLTKLNDFHGNYIEAEMVKAFIQSDEYRHRFGP